MQGYLYVFFFKQIEKSVLIGYSYRLSNNSDKEFHAHFKFDILTEGTHRKIWVYREEITVSITLSNGTACVNIPNIKAGRPKRRFFNN